MRKYSNKPKLVKSNERPKFLSVMINWNPNLYKIYTQDSKIRNKKGFIFIGMDNFNHYYLKKRSL